MNAVPGWVRWRLLMVLIFASFVSYVLRFNLSIAPQPMMAELGLTEIQWGWVMAAFPLGYAIFQFPGGVAADRFGPRRVLTLVAVAWGLLTVATALVPSADAASLPVIIGSLVLVRFLVGAAHAPIFPTVNSVVQRWFPVGGWAFPNGLTSTGLTLGAAATAPVLLWLVTAHGWRTAFVLISPLAFIVAALWWWYARDFPRQHPSIRPAEVAMIEAGREEETRIEVKPGDSWRVLKNRDVLLLTISYSCMNFVFYSVFSWFFYFLHDIRSVGDDLAQQVVSSQWIAGGIGAALGGWLCDRLCRRFGLRWGCRLPVVIAMLASGALLIGGVLTENASLAVAMFIGCFFFNQLTEGPYWASSMAIGRRQAGAAGGVMNTGANAMGVVNALLVPAVAASFGWTVAMGLGGLFAFVGAFTMLLVRSDQPLAQPDP